MAGQSTLQTYQRREPAGAPAPPFALNSAFNGLSVDTVTGQIVLGQDIGAVGDPAILVSDREIPMDTFSFFMNDALGNAIFGLDQLTPQYFLGDFALTGEGNYLWLQNVAPGTTYLSCGGLGFLQLGDVDGLGNGSVFRIDDALMDITALMNNIFRAQDSGGNRYLQLDVPTGLYQMGDIDNSVNGLKVIIADFINTFLISDAAANYFNIDAISLLSNWSFTNVGIQQDGSNNQVSLGDINAANNGMQIIIDDTANELRIANTGNNSIVRMNGVAGFTGTVLAPATITVDGGIVTNVA
jgi:hypothetical protein